MTDYRPDVTEALLAAGWTRDPCDDRALEAGDISWAPIGPEGASAIWLADSPVAEFRVHCPALVVVAACLAAAGQTAERLADVIQLHPAP
ncbi:hypothetical protein [Streptomyces sp. NPDC056723]|uniref:hypothetical protein n=1 Tax=Streptomyces sp. NPDC056723 TaxID=3345925 RepID=UPI0036AA9CF9